MVGNHFKGGIFIKQYDEFLKTKYIQHEHHGFEIDYSELNEMLFEYQRDIVKWALKKGKAAIFAGTGMGKTFMQLEWANQVHKHTDKPVLILAPLAVTQQTVREGDKFHAECKYVENQDQCINGINITNYEKLQHFNAEEFVGIVLDESSILKSFTSKYKETIIELFQHTPFKLACTATPAPNDYVELGNHSEFLNVLSRTEMLATYFVHDGGDTSKWRLKGHAENKFWEWVASWAVVITKPSDLGYSDEGFVLPPLVINEIVVDSPIQSDGNQISFMPTMSQTLTERRNARRDSINDRVKAAVNLINDNQWLVWCDLNVESEMLKKAIEGSVEVKGADKDTHKVNSAIEFANGNIKTLISKPGIYGFGMNWQSCHNMIFVGLSDSYEMLYQAIRRCYRFGQTEQVNVWIITSEAEGAVRENIMRKEKDSQNMIQEMVNHTKTILMEELRQHTRNTVDYNPQITMTIPRWLIEGGY
jgi:hypothetical protein